MRLLLAFLLLVGCAPVFAFEPLDASSAGAGGESGAGGEGGASAQ